MRTLESTTEYSSQLLRTTTLQGRSRHNSHQGPHGDACGSFRSIGFCLVTPGRTGNVEVGPGNTVRKFFKERRRCDGSSLSSTDVLNVRNVRLNLLGVFFVQR